MKKYIFKMCLMFVALFQLDASSQIVVSSKTFTESFLLGEILAQIVESVDEAPVDRKLGLGDTAIVFEGVENGKIDFYVEYSGTLSDSLLKDTSLKTLEDIRNALHKRGLTISDPLGFNNTYAISMLEKKAESLGIESIADLRAHRDLRVGFTNSFIERKDGYPLLQKVYGLDFDKVSGLSHGLKTQALIDNKIDLVDLYATDAKIAQHNLRVLSDNKKAFPEYFAVILTRLESVEKYPKTWAKMQSLVGNINDKKMAELNAEVEVGKRELGAVAGEFLNLKYQSSTKIENFLRLTKEHLLLVCVSLFAAILVGIPLGVLACRSKSLSQVVLLLTGMIQTIPSLALLCFLIPLFGIGFKPAVLALFLYSLLPIVRSTYVGLESIPTALIDSAKAIGLSSFERLKLIELPLATRNILSGIKTSAIINIGTATLAALIGAGGYGDPIVTGLGLNDVGIILEGAIPAALLALLAHGLFELIDKFLIPKGLR